MKHVSLNKIVAPAACTGLLLASGGMLLAAETKQPDTWQNSFTLYGWFPSMSGKLKYDLGGSDSGSVDAGDILDALNMTFMGAFEARRSRWSILADVIYLDLGDKANGTVELPGNLELGTEVDLEIKGWQAGLYGGYNLYNTEKASLDVLAGLRYLKLDTDAELSISGPLPPELPSAKLSASADIWDGIVGFRGKARLNEHWFVPYYADIGTGDSDLTWQAMVGIGYEAGWGDTILLYRHLEWDEGDDGLLQGLSFNGPALAFKFHF